MSAKNSVTQTHGGGTTAVAVQQQPELPAAIARRGIDEFQWRTLTNNLFPGARTESVLMVVDYCRARKLDPLKKPCHIVPMEVKDARTNTKAWRDVVMPGIYEYRTTAQRTGEYLGHAKPEYGPVTPFGGVEAPEYCEFTVYRWNGLAGQRVEYPVRVFFREVVALKDGKANQRWFKAPIQMLTKCAEAAALREAFPDELGGEQTAEEMDGQRIIDVTETVAQPPALPKPDKYDDWLIDMQATAEEGDLAKLEQTWADSSEACRTYLTTTDPGYYESLKARVAAGKVSA